MTVALTLCPAHWCRPVRFFDGPAEHYPRRASRLNLTSLSSLSTELLSTTPSKIPRCRTQGNVWPTLCRVKNKGSVEIPRRTLIPTLGPVRYFDGLKNKSRDLYLKVLMKIPKTTLAELTALAHWSNTCRLFWVTMPNSRSTLSVSRLKSYRSDTSHVLMFLGTVPKVPYTRSHWLAPAISQVDSQPMHWLIEVER